MIDELDDFLLFERDAAVQLAEVIARRTGEDVFSPDELQSFVDKLRAGHTEFWLYPPRRKLFWHVLPHSETPEPERAVPYELDPATCGVFFEVDLASMGISVGPLTIHEMISRARRPHLVGDHGQTIH